MSAIWADTLSFFSRSRALATLSLLSAPGVASAASSPAPPASSPAPPASSPAPPASSTVKSDEPAAARSPAEKREERNLVVIPLIARSAETSFQFGAAGIYLFRKAKDEIPRSNLTGSALVSVRKQFISSLGTNIYLLGDQLRVSATLEAFIWPTQFFRQTPASDVPESYSYRGAKGEVLLASKLVGGLFAGPSFRFSRQENAVPAGGLMERSGLTGLRGHSAAGPGVSIALDSRDIAYAPSRGVYIGVTTHYLFGLDSRTKGFLDTKIFGRWYLSSDSARNIFAFALALEAVEGEPPFSLMPTSDGTTVLRGIKRLRYYDRALSTAQIEYRRDLGRWGPTGPWGVTLFAEAGDFFKDLHTSNKLVVSTGAGLRYFVIPKERVSLRLDVAYVDGGVGIVLNALEAF